jgi:hypothetical protein
MTLPFAGTNVFTLAGVPGAGEQVGDAQAFAGGGIAQRVSRGDLGEQAIVIDVLNISLGMSKSGAEEVFVSGGSGETGQKVIVNQIKAARRERAL